MEETKQPWLYQCEVWKRIDDPGLKGFTRSIDDAFGLTLWKRAKEEPHYFLEVADPEGNLLSVYVMDEPSLLSILPQIVGMVRDLREIGVIPNSIWLDK